MNETNTLEQFKKNLDLTEDFCKLIGKLQFLNDYDLGSITRNETASELLEEVLQLKEKLNLNI